MMHWQLSVPRSHLRLIGYAVMAAIIGVGLLIGSGMADRT
jgi:hypothetical protein